MTARLIIAAPESGSGKTLITAGLCYALRQQGLQVQMFKAGPDYIDPTYHQLASKRPCRNLDSWMLPTKAITESFQRNSHGCDLALIEGVMGLFDGFGVSNDTGSTAELAQLLQAPVILVLPVRGQARSAASTLLGFHTFSPHLAISGVILNQVGSEKHAQLCQQAIEAETAVPVLGYLPRSEALVLPERHLGLVPTQEMDAITAVIEEVGAQLATTTNFNQLLQIAQNTPTLPSFPQQQTSLAPEPVVRLAVAKDAAFSFIYPENVELLTEAGAEIIYFSPLHDDHLPANIDGVILSGGFPELYAAELSANEAMLTALRQAAAARLPIYAECGGLMYLTAAISDQNGQQRPMVGLLPGTSEMTQRVTLGYRLVEAVTDGPLLPAGAQVRGHEFHYSQWQPPTNEHPVYALLDPYGNSDEKRFAGFQQGTVWASYIHLHFLAQPSMAARFVAWCRQT